MDYGETKTYNMKINAFDWIKAINLYQLVNIG